MAATHEIVPGADGLFELKRVAGATPPPEATLLAATISTELRRFKGRSGEAGLKRLARLRQIAELGLVAPEPDLPRARAELRSEFQHAYVRLSESGGIVVEIPFDVSAAQFAFLMKLQDADRLVRQLASGRGVPAARFWRWLGAMLAGLPDRLGALLGKPPPDTSQAQDAAAFAAAQQDAAAAERAYRRYRDAMIVAGRLAVPDDGSGRLPDLPLAEAHLAAALKEAVTRHGPLARKEYLADLAAAFAGVTLVFVLLVFGLYAMWGLVIGWDALSKHGRPPYSHFSLAAIAVVFLFVGAWLSSAQRLNAPEAAVIESSFAEPFDSWIRGCVLLGAGLLVMLLLHKEVVVIALASDATGLSTARIFSSFTSAVVVGALLGFGERVLPGVLASQSGRIVDRLGMPGGSAPAVHGGASAPPARSGTRDAPRDDAQATDKPKDAAGAPPDVREAASGGPAPSAGATEAQAATTDPQSKGRGRPGKKAGEGQ